MRQPVDMNFLIKQFEMMNLGMTPVAGGGSQQCLMNNSSCSFSSVSQANTPTTAASGASSQMGASLAEQISMLDIDETPMAQ